MKGEESMEWMLLPLKRYAEFSGRSRRMEYWMFVVLQFLVNMALYVVSLVLIGGSAMMMASGGGAGAAASGAALGGGVVIMLILYAVVTLGLIIPGIAVSVRRLHDTDRSGWWILAPLLGYLVVGVGAATHSSPIAVIGAVAGAVLAIAVLVFLFLDGTVGPNRFGPDPKGRADAAVFA